MIKDLKSVFWPTNLKKGFKKDFKKGFRIFLENSL
jgi:hypothetical protein